MNDKESTTFSINSNGSLSPEPYSEPSKEEWETAGEKIRNQEPLNTVYESSDFKQGLNRGVWMTVNHILGALRQEIKDVSEPMMVDKEYIDGLERAIEKIEEHYK